MSDRREASLAHERQRLQQVETADIVPDGFHGAALISQRFEIGLVIGEQRVRGRQRHVAALGQLRGVLAVGKSAQADHDLVADLVVGGMQAEDASGLLSRSGQCFGEKQIGRNAAAGLGGIADETENVRACVDLFLHAHSSGQRLPSPGSGPITSCIPRRISARRRSQSARVRTGFTAPLGSRQVSSCSRSRRAGRG
jgi:hypothetical protein